MEPARQSLNELATVARGLLVPMKPREGMLVWFITGCKRKGLYRVTEVVDGGVSLKEWKGGDA